MTWYALYTKPHNERLLEKRLLDAGYTAWCPVYPTIRQWSDRTKKGVAPAIPSYCLVALEDYKRDCSQVLDFPGAVRFLHLSGIPAVVREQEVVDLRSFLEGITKNMPGKKLQLGASVMVTRGAFNGRSGEVVSVQGLRVRISLPSLGLASTIELPASLLEQIHPIGATY